MTHADTPARLREQLAELTIHDEHRLGRRLAGTRKIRSAARRARVVAEIASEVAAARDLVMSRRSCVPSVSYPPDLPISEHRDALARTISDHPVVVVAGETGSGKSTQLPKICLDIGRGVRGTIGHTQPRRLAARSIADRIAEELATPLGGTVGYTVRFTDQVGPNTLVKVMTDGILLAEMQQDRLLTRYDTIIVDEAHERSLNIDFLLGYLKGLLARRDDLKVIITSATIDTERFAAHFGGAPVVEVSGRTYPVEVRYRPLDGGDGEPSRDQPQGIVDAARELVGHGPGDILVFCSGEREIRDAADALERASLPATTVFPLYARLSAAEQHRVFESHAGRRIVVATNVAETSLTVPGVRYVIDAGTARISRYSRRTKTQRLPIEAVSQASADQRSGRCGRIGPGVAIRLYSQDDYENRPRFTEPEIQRTNLAAVILAMASLRLGDISSFPFVDAPDTRNIRDGVALLEELAAVKPGSEGTDDWLTPVGRRLARLPVDPRFGRMVLEADRLGCLHEVMVIAAGLSIQDPRERPADARSAADEMHARFVDPESDFFSLLALWDYVGEERRARTSNQFRKLCRREFLNYARVREWQDLFGQLRRIAQTLDLHENPRPADRDLVHRALLSGLLSHVGLRDEKGREYSGARNARFLLGRESSLATSLPSWVMVADLVETNRLWGRMAARIEPEWIEHAGAHLVKRSYGEPWWDRDRGAASTHERVTLYGLPVVTHRRADYARIDPADARSMFIHHALVEGDWNTHHRFVERNRGILDEVRSLQVRSRRSDLMADHETRHAFFDTRIPVEVRSAADFDRWWRDEQRTDPTLLDLSLDDLLARDAEVDQQSFPEELRHGGVSLPLAYEYDPSSESDGVVVTIPVGDLGRVGDAVLDWHVPGLREEMVNALVRSLPKHIRKELSPIASTVADFLGSVDPEESDLVTALQRDLGRRAGMEIPADALAVDRLPPHLRPRYRVVGVSGRTLAEGPDLARLRAELDSGVRATVSRQGHALETSGMTTWDCGSLPHDVTVTVGGHSVTMYPSLVDEGDTVAVRLLASEAEQADAMWRGTRRLLRLNVPGAAKALKRVFSNELALAVAASPYSGPAALFEDCIGCALDALMREHGTPVRDAQDFDDLVRFVRARFEETIVAVVRDATEILTRHARLRASLDRTTTVALQPSVAEMGAHLDRLVYPGFLTNVGPQHLADVERYLRALEYRLERLPTRVARDRELTERCRSLEAHYARLAESRGWSPELEAIAWSLEELRVSLFAQPIGTAAPVSDKRVLTALSQLERR